jgi:heme-degrading monooxygenase HmoA
MVTEIAILNVKPGLEKSFESAFGRAQAIIAATPGYCSHQLQKCIENSSRYLLIVNWQTLEDHTVGFRQSAEYQQWKELLHHFYEPFPTVEHFSVIYENKV